MPLHRVADPLTDHNPYRAHRNSAGVLGGFQGSSLHERGVEGSEQVGGGLPSKGFAGSPVEVSGDVAEVVGTLDAQVGALGEVVA